MIVTALLMGVALKGDKPLTDGEIRVRAMALGMVDGESRTLAGIQTPQASDQSPPVSSEPTEPPEGTAPPASTPTATPTAAPTPTVIPTSPPEDEELPKPLPMVTPKPSATTSPEPADEPLLPTPMSTPTPEPTESVTFVIHSGQSSYGVSKSLVEAGLVEDALDFDQYLENNGYSKRISTGTYEIPVGSTEEEIAKIITRSR